MKEKRKLERFDLRLPVKLRLTGEYSGSDEEEWSLFTQNICSGGAFLSTNTPHFLPEGVSLELQLELYLEGIEPRAQVLLSGRVLRSESAGIAVRFDKCYEIKPLPEKAVFHDHLSPPKDSETPRH